MILKKIPFQTSSASNLSPVKITRLAICWHTLIEIILLCVITSEFNVCVVILFF